MCWSKPYMLCILLKVTVYCAINIFVVKKHVPREKDNSWNVSKFHELKRLVQFIEAFGSPRGYYASLPEEHHKDHQQRQRAHKGGCWWNKL